MTSTKYQICTRVGACTKRLMAQVLDPCSTGVQYYQFQHLLQILHLGGTRPVPRSFQYIKTIKYCASKSPHITTIIPSERYLDAACITN